MKRFREQSLMDEDPLPEIPTSPTAPLVEYPEDYDQFEHPYNYDGDLPDDQETQEELEQVRESWSLSQSW